MPNAHAAIPSVYTATRGSVPANLLNTCKTCGGPIHPETIHSVIRWVHITDAEADKIREDYLVVRQ